MTTWQDKRVNAMNRKIARKGAHLYDKYIDEHFSVTNSNAKNKKVSPRKTPIIPKCTGSNNRARIIVCPIRRPTFKNC